MKSDWLTIINWIVYLWCPKTCLLLRDGTAIKTCKTVQEAEDAIREDTGYTGLIVWKEGTE